MQRELIALWRETDLKAKTVVFVTHDITEAVLLADRIVLMTARPGRIKQVVPVTLPRPRDPFDPEVATLSHALDGLLQGEIARSIEHELAASAGE